jgi:hypothetical protein
VTEGIAVRDDEGAAVEFDSWEAGRILALAGNFDAATVSACPDCHSRVVAAVALVDLLDSAAPHPRGRELMDLADDAPTLHLYVIDRDADCRHLRWRDPLFEEWLEVVETWEE